MARHEVTGQAQPQNEGSIPADEADRLPKMPLAPGSRIRPAVENTQSSKSGSVAVKGVPADDGGLPPQMPVPSSSVYTPPPAKVVAASDGLEPSR